MPSAVFIGDEQDFDQFEYWDSGAAPDISTKEYKYKILLRGLRCTLCPPNQGENATRHHGRKKKAYQLDPERRRDITRRIVIRYSGTYPQVRRKYWQITEKNY